MTARFAKLIAAFWLCVLPFVSAQPPSRRPQSTREDAIAVLQRAGVLSDGRRVQSVWPMGDHWIVVVRDRDGTRRNYSSHPLTDDCAEICRH